MATSWSDVQWSLRRCQLMLVLKCKVEKFVNNSAIGRRDCAKLYVVLSDEEPNDLNA